MRYLCLLLALAGSARGAALHIQQAAIERFEDGPPLTQSDAFTAGEVVHFSFFAGGFERKDNQVSVSFEAQPKDPAGLLLTPRVPGKQQTMLTPEDKDWRPKLRGDFALPGILLPGEYSVEIQLKDDLAGTSVSQTLPFTVSGPHVNPTGVLSIQSLHFYRNETDERPLQTAAYRLNEEVHVRFLVLGFRHDEKGADHVSYGITLTDPAGQVMFSNPSAAQDEGADLYPKPYVPAIMSFSLKPGSPLGDYTLTVNADDLVGKQQTQTRQTFRLE